MISLHSMHNTLCLFSLDTFHFTLARNVQSCVVSLLLGIELHVRWFTMLWNLLRKRYTIPRNQTNVWTFVVTVSVSLLSLTISESLPYLSMWSSLIDRRRQYISNPAPDQLMYNNKATWPSSCSVRRSLFWFNTEFGLMLSVALTQAHLCK